MMVFGRAEKNGLPSVYRLASWRGATSICPVLQESQVSFDLEFPIAGVSVLRLVLSVHDIAQLHGALGDLLEQEGLTGAGIFQTPPRRFDQRRATIGVHADRSWGKPQVDGSIPLEGVST